MVNLCFSVLLLFFGGLGTDGWVVFQRLYGFLRSFEEGLGQHCVAMALFLMNLMWMSVRDSGSPTRILQGCHVANPYI